jgi:hypothetical protein
MADAAGHIDLFYRLEYPGQGRHRAWSGLGGAAQVILPGLLATLATAIGVVFML